VPVGQGSRNVGYGNRWDVAGERMAAPPPIPLPVDRSIETLGAGWPREASSGVQIDWGVGVSDTFTLNCDERRTRRVLAAFDLPISWFAVEARGVTACPGPDVVNAPSFSSARLLVARHLGDGWGRI
jgi:hypothetical protein